MLLQHSRSPWVQSRFAAGGGSSGGGLSSGSTGAPGAGSRRKDTRFKGVAAKFQQQLEELLALVGFSDPHFVRCVMPNQKKPSPCPIPHPHPPPNPLPIPIPNPN